MGVWELELSYANKSLGNVTISEGGLLVPLLFAVVLIHLTKKNAGPPMSLLKLIWKYITYFKRMTSCCIQKLKSKLRIFNKNVGMHFVVNECAFLITKKGGKGNSDGLLLPQIVV